ncbi:MAG: winged helix DNA-binding domain-containing protein [Bacteroidota bacterium]|nr:winged helix DNA-binding domain-containing protein [Bacteroidota bacterium]
MTLSEIATLRIRNQQIEGSEFQTVKELVSWMGAMQAQDFAMVKWAVGLRMPHSTEKIIDTAYNQGEIIRTHLMRPTWHLVAADDIYWMLELTAPRIKPLLKARDKQLELDELIYAKSNRMLEKVLANGQCLTREELVREYDRVHIRTDENRLSHLMLRAELDGVVCSGPLKATKLTYSLLCDRVPAGKVLTRDEALAELATRYFKSHSPATLRDFVWWSGLSVTDARKAMDMIRFSSVAIGTDTYWLSNSFSNVPSGKPSIHLLPAYDEFLIGYTDRRAALATVHNKKAISENGIFRPVILVNGLVTGLWKRNTKKDMVKIETNHFQIHDEEILIAIDKESTRYGLFLNKKTELTIQSFPET